MNEWVKVAQSCPTLCDPMDCTVHGILQTRILDWVAFSFSRGSSWPRNQTRSPALQADCLPTELSGKLLLYINISILRECFMQTSHTHSSPRLWQYVAIFLWKTIWYILVLSCLLVLHEDLWWYWGWKKRISREVFEMQIYSSRFPIRSLEIRGYWKKKPRVNVQSDSFFFFFLVPQKWNVKSRQCISFHNPFF